MYCSFCITLFCRYDIVIDATDNVATRYLLNDACVLARKPLVSGSALRFEGQVIILLCVYGFFLTFPLICKLLS